jgi:hypothetical protein
VPIFTLTDFDYNGYEIAATLQRNTRRYTFKRPILPLRSSYLWPGSVVGTWC